VDVFVTNQTRDDTSFVTDYHGAITPLPLAVKPAAWAECAKHAGYFIEVGYSSGSAATACRARSLGLRSFRRPKSYVVPVVGLEPTRPFEQSILSAPRLPFRHTGAQQRGKQYRRVGM
jgi:hypothetical protein